MRPRRAGDIDMVITTITKVADQTAVATLDIERFVQQMQQTVNAGVEEMGRFAGDVQQGVTRVTGISTQFAGGTWSPPWTASPKR